MLQAFAWRHCVRQRLALRSRGILEREGSLSSSVDELELFGGRFALGACLEGLERGLEDSHFAAASDELGSEFGELGVEVGAELLNGILEAVVGGDLFGLADLNGFEIGEDGIEEQVVQGIDLVIHEQIVSGDGTMGRITGEWALVIRGERSLEVGSSYPIFLWQS